MNGSPASEPAGGESALPGEAPLTANRYIILGIVLTAVFMSVLDTNVVYLAIRPITIDFNADLAQTQWVITSYLIVNTSLLLIFGRLSEYTGRTRLFLAGIAIFTVSSLACGLSSSVAELIFFRIVQGIGASVVYSINMSILVMSFPRDERGRVFGFSGMTVAIGSIVGPSLGGFIISAAGWPYVFLINVPIGFVLLAVALKYLKISEKTSAQLNMDWAGSGTIIAAIVSLMLLLGSLADNVSLTLPVCLYGLVFAFSLVAFLFVESRNSYPIVDLSAFRVRKFAFANMSTLINFVAYSMLFMSMPFYLMDVMGYNEFQAGQVLMVVPLVMVVVSPLSGLIYDRTRSHYHSSFGMLVMALSLIALGLTARAASLPLLLACLAFFGVGSGLFTSPNNSEIMDALPLHKAPIASSTIATVRNFGNAIGISLVSILLCLAISGPVTGASAAAMAGAVSVVVLIAGLLCFAGMGTSLLIGRK